MGWKEGTEVQLSPYQTHTSLRECAGKYEIVLPRKTTTA